jgi:hypothetical protein
MTTMMAVFYLGGLILSGAVILGIGFLASLIWAGRDDDRGAERDGGMAGNA